MLIFMTFTLKLTKMFSCNAQIKKVLSIKGNKIEIVHNDSHLNNRSSME